MVGTIDVHHHLIPQRFRELWFSNIEKARGLVLPKWEPEGTLGLIDEVGLSAIILSMGHPVHPYVKDPSEIGPICREINEYTAKLRDEHPDKLGFLATLPPMDSPEVCIEEIRYAFDVLKADGVVIFSSYSKRYLGHPDFRAVWAELNSRKAVALIHPGFEGMDPIEEPRHFAPTVIDWTHETTRTACHLITTGITRQFPDVKIILSHAGGTLPYVIRRAANLCCRIHLVDFSEEEFIEEARKFYIDVAFSAYDPQLRLLKEFAKPGHVLFGSDYPWEHGPVVASQLGASDRVFASETLDAALQLFPRLKQYHGQQ
ncbi:amidohydrolase family protein [Corynascus similis CBS 632.67]